MDNGQPQAFHDAVSMVDYPMAVVTAAADGRRAGCLVGFNTQCSISPPRYLTCVSRANHTFPVAMASEWLVVHLLDVVDLGLARRFGERTGDDVDKFAGLAVLTGPGGAPVLADCRAWFAGRVLGRLDLGDHVGFLLEPGDGSVQRPLRQLGFQRVRAMEPGHARS